jgi:hypothetical protein
MNLYDYLSSQVPNDCYMVMQNRVGNIPKPRNSRQMAMMLRKYVQTFGKDALQDLASIHPDKELISNQSSFGLNEGFEVVEPKKVDSEYIESSYKGCGCGENCGKSNCGCKTMKKCNCGNEDNYSNFVSPNSPQSYSDLNPQSKTHEIIISMGVVILGLAVLVKVMK